MYKVTLPLCLCVPMFKPIGTFITNLDHGLMDLKNPVTEDLNRWSGVVNFHRKLDHEDVCISSMQTYELKIILSIFCIMQRKLLISRDYMRCKTKRVRVCKI